MGTEELLRENIKEFTKQAIRTAEEGSYNTAATLFFKAIAVICDLYILKNEGIIPKSHTERFQLLKSKYPPIYKIIDRDFPIYQQSYNLRLNREYALLLENDLKKLAKLTGISKESKKNKG